MTSTAAVPRPGRSPFDGLWLLVALVVAAVGVLAVLFHVAAWLVAVLSGGSAPGLVETFEAIRSSPLHPAAGYTDPPGPAWALYTVQTVIGLVVGAGVFWLVVLIGRDLMARRRGLTRPRQLRPLLEAKATERARTILANTNLGAQLAEGYEPETGELVTAVGVLEGKQLYGQHEDSYLVVSPPRQGKTTRWVVPRILEAPGPTVVTGTKNDVFFLTASTCSDRGSVYVLDVMGITGWPDSVRIDPVLGCKDPDEALERGRAWAAADPRQGGARNADWFAARAGEVLAYLLHAAALKPSGNMKDVMRWASNFADNEPVRILRDAGTTTEEHDPRPESDEDAEIPATVTPSVVDYGTHTWADLLVARTQSRAGETTDSLQMTLSGILSPLTSPRILESVCPPSGKAFDVQQFLAGRNTLYLLSGKGAANVAPLVTTLIDVIVRTATRASQHAPGGRLSPPLRLVLEEAANVAPLPDLPGLMSDAGGRGLEIHVIVQSRAQMEDRWGRSGADAISAAATCRLYLPGISEDSLLKELSTAADRYRAKRTSVSSSPTGGSVTDSEDWENVMTPVEISNMPPGTALMFYAGLPAAHVSLTPWWERDDAEGLRAGVAEVQELTGRVMQ